MRAESTIRRQLKLLEEEQRRAVHEDDRSALYGAAQALAWALGRDAMAPAFAFSDDRRQPRASGERGTDA